MSAAIAEPATIAIHDREIAWLNQLIVDLKLYFSGMEGEMSESMTMERLNKFSDIRRKLYECRRVDRVRH